MNKSYSVIVTDVQGCFTMWKKGSLAVPGTDEAYVRSVEAATRQLKTDGCFVIATQDWHPPDHVSFAENHPGKKPFDVIEIAGRRQVLWPTHCVQGTDDAELLLDADLFDAVIRKATDPRVDSYSAVQDEYGLKTGLDDMLRKRDVTSVIIYGIATDYCVKSTAIDLVRDGFKVVAIEALCRGVAPETSAQALLEMRTEGIRVLPDLDMSAVRSLF